MASKHKSRTRNAVVRCPNCGEDYSVTYKCCPFCDESSGSARGRGGKRLNTRGGGYGGGGGWGPLRVITTVLSVALIVAAVYIVVTIVKPLVELGSSQPGSTVSPTASAQAEPSASPIAQPSVEPSAEPAPDPTIQPTAGPATAPVSAESFTLNASDFTLTRAGETYHIRATFSPAGTNGAITWTSSNPASVHVADDGTVTALANGNSTITAELENGYAQKCIVRCGWSGEGTYPTPGTDTALAINRTDITMSSEGETFTLKVTGTSAVATWTSSNPTVATVSSDGKVTAVSGGTATVTANINGQAFKCIIRCSF